MLDLLFPTKDHLALKWLGTKNWLEVTVDPIKGHESQVNAEVAQTLDDSKRFKQVDMDRGYQILESYATRANAAAFFLYQVSRSIAEGPKLFRPTYDQCLGLEHTNLNFSFEDYKQPYPTVIIELPKEFRDRIKEEYSVTNPPFYVLVNKIEPQNVISVSAWFSHENIIVNLMGPRSSYTSIEDALLENRKNLDPQAKFTKLNENKVPEDELTTDVECDIAEMVQRLGINFAMMMCIKGIRTGGPVNTTQEKIDQFKRTLSNKKADPDKKIRAARMLAGTTLLTEFIDQKITFYKDKDRSHESTGPSSPTGIKVKPHWRKGHYQSYWIGIGHIMYDTATPVPLDHIPAGIDTSFRKYWKHIEALRVHKDIFPTDSSKVKVVYVGRNGKRDTENQ